MENLIEHMTRKQSRRFASVRREKEEEEQVEKEKKVTPVRVK